MNVIRLRFMFCDSRNLESSMKVPLRCRFCIILFMFPVLANGSDKLPMEEIQRQMLEFDDAKSTDAKLQAAGLLARLIQADGREEDYYRMFRKQAEADPAATAPLLALSECMRVWGCTVDSAKLLTEATKRQSSDFKLQALLAKRLEQTGEPNRAAPILARLVAEHRSPEHLRRYAAFLFRTGDIDQGSTLASQLALEAMDGREPEALAQELMSLREWTTSRDFLTPLLAKFPGDWRLSYVHACAMERLAPDDKAFAAFLNLTTDRAEVPDLITPVNDSEEFQFHNSPERREFLSRLSPEDALLSRYHATAHTAYPADLTTSSSFYTGGIDSHPGTPLPFLALPATVMDLRLHALRHSFTVAAGLPVAARSELLAQIKAPDFPFLDALKNAALAPSDGHSSPVRPVATISLSRYPANDEASIRLTDISKALQAAMVTADYATAADLTNQAIKLHVQRHSSYSLINSPSYSRAQQLYRLASKPSEPFSPNEIRALFQINGLTQSLADRGATFLTAPSPKPPLPSPARVELLKILGETTSTAAPETPPAFEITAPDKFLAAVARIESPFHRVLILHACGMEDALRQTLADLTNEDAAPDGDILLWASAYQANEGHDLPRAYELAIRARAALGPEHHAAADAQLVTLGLLLLREKETTPDLSAAKSAALEFSRFAVEESTRKALADVFKSFGQDEAAAQLAQPHLIADARLRENSIPRKSPEDAAAAAISADRPAALRLLYRHLRAMLRCGRLDRSSYFSPNGTIESVQQLHLVPDLAATMLPPPGASYERRRNYAIIMAKIDNLTITAPQLERLHSEQPDDTAILSLLCVASPMPRRLELFDQLCQFPTDDLSDFTDAIIPKLRPEGVRDADDYRSMIAEWRSFSVLLAALPPGKGTFKNLAWLNEAAARLAASSPSFHDFLSGKQVYQGWTNETAASQAQLRDTAVKEVALAMLKHPETATLGFTLLAAGKSPFGLDEEALATMAMDAYRAKLSAADFQEPDPAKRYISYNREGHLRNFESSSVDLTWKNLTPFLHMFAHAAARKSFYQVTDFLPKLAEPARGEITAWLDYFATPSPAAAIALLQSLDRECQDHKSENVLTLALEITALCNLSPIPGLEMLVDQTGVTASRTSTSFRSTDFPPIISLMRTISTHFQCRGSIDLATPLLSRAVARVLGPPSCWPLYAKVLGERHDEYSSIEQRHQTFTSILCLDDIDRGKPDFTILRIGLATGLLGIDGTHPNLPTIDSYCRESRCAGDLISSGLFQPGPGMFLADGTFLPLIVARLMSDKPEADPAKVVGVALLTVDGPNRFWARLAGAYWARRDASLPLAEVTREFSTIEQWSPAEQRALARFLKQRWPELATSKLAVWLEQTLRPDSAELETALRKLPERFSTDSAKAAEIPPLLFPLIEHTPQQAAAVWLEILTTTPAAASQRAHRLLMEALLDYKTPYPTVAPANQVTFLLTLLQSNSVTVSSYDHGPVLEKFIRLLIDSPPLDSKPNPGFKNLIGIRSKAFATLLLCLRTFDDSAAAHLVDSLLKNHRSLCDYQHASSQAILTWLETTIAPDRPQLAKAARLVMRAGSPPPNPLPAVEALEPALLEFLNAPKLPPLTRLNLLLTACETLENFVHSPPIAREAISILARSELDQTAAALTAYTVLTKLEASATLTPELAAACCTAVIPKLFADGALPEDHRKWLHPYWLRLAAKSGQDALFTQAHRADGTTTTGDLDLIMLLLQRGMVQAAATLAPSPQLPAWSMADQAYGYPNAMKIPRFTAAIQDHLPRFLQQLPDAGQRFRMELLIANFPDAEALEKPALSRADRLRQLGARFPAEAPRELLARSELLAILGAGEPPVNLNEMLTLTDGLSYADLFDSKTTAHNSYDIAKARPAIIRLSLIDRTIEATLQTGRSDYWCKQMVDLARFSDLRSKAKHFEAMTELLDTYGPKFISLALSAPAAEHDRLLREAKAVVLPFANADNVNREVSISNTCYQFLLLTHLATGRGKDFAGCWNSLPDSLTKPRERTPEYSGALVLECFRRENFTASDGSNTTVRLFNALLMDPDLSMLILPRMDHLHRLTEVNFVTREEISNAIEAVPDTFPRKAIYLIGRAGLCRYYDSQTDIALKDCSRAIQLAETQRQPAVVELAKATQVSVLVRGDRNPEAAKIAATVDADKLDEGERKNLTDLREFLKSKSEEK
jgi:hypothetical protein